MGQAKNFKVLWRAAFVIISVVFMASGITYAALQSQQIKLTGNTIETATANLLISSDGQYFATSKTGFAFNNLIPGGSPSPGDGYSIYLKNSGGTMLGLKFAISSIPTNPDNVDLSKVNVILTPIGFNAGPTQTFTMENLINSNATGGLPITSPTQILVTETLHYTIKVSMAADAISSQSASLGNIDFAFIGIAKSN